MAATTKTDRTESQSKQRRVEITPHKGRFTIAHPVPDHLVNLRQYMRHTEGPDRIGDAHIAAIAIENDATVITHDLDFRRIPAAAS